MAKLTVYNPDNSMADILLIPDTLALELSRVIEYSKRESLDLALLREIKLKVLSMVYKILKEKNIQINNLQGVEGFALSNISNFSSLLDVISRIEKLPNANSLTIYLSE